MPQPIANAHPPAITPSPAPVTVQNRDTTPAAIEAVIRQCMNNLGKDITIDPATYRTRCETYMQRLVQKLELLIINATQLEKSKLLDSSRVHLQYLVEIEEPVNKFV